MDDLQSEKEQIEEMRAWWAEYGRYVIAGVVIAVGLLIGFNQYKSAKVAAQIEASVLFETLVGHIADGDLDDAVPVADQLASHYVNTSYAPQSKLAMARLYMDKNRDEDAATVLRELLEMRSYSEIKFVGRLRLARILLYQDKPQDVIVLLADQDSLAFSGLYAEARGDAYAALGQVAAAGEQYRTALADTTQTVNRGLVQMKLVDLPEPESDAVADEPETSESEADVEAAPEEMPAEPDAEPIATDEEAQ